MPQTQLEACEWSEFWYTQAPDTKTRRVLIIGDSISKGFRVPLAKILAGKYNITCLTTSKALDNPYLIPELELMTKQDDLPYDVVHFNNGAHGSHLTPDMYEELYDNFIVTLKRMFPEARIIMATTTHMMDENYNNQSLARNERARKLAEKYDLAVDDLYAVGAKNPKLHCEDRIHFTDEGWEEIAKKVAESILSV